MVLPAALHGENGAPPPWAAAPAAISALDDRVRTREGDPWQLLQEALVYAVEAYQKLAEQAAEIHHLQALSVTDPLTGLANRRGFDQQLDRALALAARYGETGVVALLDLDNLKQLNDRYGHAVGDAMLRQLARTVVRNVRSTDVVARLGGDEFAVILLRTPAADGQARARALQAMLNRTSVEADDLLLPIQVSMGVMPYGPTSEPERLLDIVDRQMYRDKARRRAGSGRVRCAVTA